MLLAVLALAATGCGSDDDPDATPPSTAATSGVEAAAPEGPGSEQEGEVTLTEDVEYGTGEVADGSVPLLMDVYEPALGADAPRPVVVVIHGGGFRQQSKADPGIVQIAEALAARGVVAVSIDYRLIPQQPVPSARVAPLADALGDGELFTGMAAAVDDTLTATAFLAAHADDLGIDVGRLGLVGSSAGAITADHVAYVLDDHGVEGPEVTVVGSLWGGLFVGAPDGGETAAQLDADEAALFAVHGDADERVPVTLSDELAARAEAVGVPVEYHRLAGGRHGYEPSGFLTEPVEGDQTAFDRLVVFVSAQLGIG